MLSRSGEAQSEASEPEASPEPAEDTGPGTEPEPGVV